MALTVGKKQREEVLTRSRKSRTQNDSLGGMWAASKKSGGEGKKRLGQGYLTLSIEKGSHRHQLSA